MRLAVLAVGRLKDGPERELCQRYAGRITDNARALGFSGLDVIEIAESRSRRADERKLEEAAALRARRPAGMMILLDERGKNLGSEEFAGLMGRARDAGTPSLSLSIGGADGLDPVLRSEADLVLGFGALTLPHQLVRVLALEQIYRALTILSGHPYHRA